MFQALEKPPRFPQRIFPGLGIRPLRGDQGQRDLLRLQLP